MLVALATATARTLAHIVAVLLAASWISSGGYLIEALIHINLRVRTALTTPVLRSPPNPLLGFSLIDPFTTAILFGAVLSIATWPIRSGPDPSRARSRVGGHTLALAFDCGRGSADAGPRTQPCRPLSQCLEHVQSYFAATREQPEWIRSLPFGARRLGAAWDRVVEAKGNLRALLEPYTANLDQLIIGAAHALADSSVQVLLSLNSRDNVLDQRRCAGEGTA